MRHVAADVTANAGAVLMFLAHEFSFGNETVSAADNVGDGRDLGTVVGNIAAAILSNGLT